MSAAVRILPQLVPINFPTVNHLNINALVWTALYKTEPSFGL